MVHDIERNQKLLEDIKRLLVIKTPIYLTTPIVVKTSPHTEIYRCYGVNLTIDNKLMLMDADEEWHEILPNQVNAGYVLQSVFQRLKAMQLETEKNNTEHS